MMMIDTAVQSVIILIKARVRVRIVLGDSSSSINCITITCVYYMCRKSWKLVKLMHRIG